MESGALNVGLKTTEGYCGLFFSNWLFFACPTNGTVMFKTQATNYQSTNSARATELSAT
jgi:hypothetical protein